MSAPRWDIFCRVVDNYGDIGVCWRLARQLVAEHGVQVRLWVDNLGALNQINPDADPAQVTQILQGVRVNRWAQEWHAADVADVVIEAFGCQLPDRYLSSMTARADSPLWINLEYLSAEQWVDSWHGLPSLQSGGLKKFFFFPGFTELTGGLPRESDLFERRRRFQNDPGQRRAFLATINVERPEKARLMSLFAYENAGLCDWLDRLSFSEEKTLLLVPEGRSVPDLIRWAVEPSLRCGDSVSRGGLTVQVIPFVRQEDYDRLLWSCDFNVVRGEDSLVRAQWAAVPFMWQPYPQVEDAHLQKLDAFLAIYGAGLPEDVRVIQADLWRAWSTEKSMQGWSLLVKHQQTLLQHAESWCRQLGKQKNLAEQLVKFSRNWI